LETGRGRPRDIRAAENESTFRAINEQLLGPEVMLEGRGRLREIVCECPQLDCTELVSLTVDEYELVRSEGERFVVAPSEEHIVGGVEHVVLKRERYWVVEKVGAAGGVAEELDPRDADK
jgi:hypothetical protein